MMVADRELNTFDDARAALWAQAERAVASPTAAGAATVVRVWAARDVQLRTELQKLARSDGNGALNALGATEGPAGSAGSLVLNWSDDTLCTPVYFGRQIYHFRRLAGADARSGGKRLLIVAHEVR